MHNSQNKDAYAALKRQVLTKVMGHAEARMENAGILELNSDTLLGIKTLKKIFGLEKASPDYFPFMGTRNVLAQYCGFEDWAHWVRDLLGGESESERGAELVSIGVPASIGFPNVPFRNLNWFRREDARVFFGRNAEIRKILSFLREPLHDHWVLLYGQSGVGKSSFLNAGLHPRLEADFEVLVFRVSRDLPPENLFRSIQGAAIGVQKPLVVVLDQLETVFRRDMFSGPNWIMELAGLIEVCSFDITLILSFRKEFFAEIDAVLTEAEISFTRFFLKPLDSNGIEDAILGITQNRAANFKYQLKIDPEVPEAILDLIGSDDKSHIAPTLQIILTRLWERATEMGKWPPVFSSQLLLDNIKTRSHFLGEYIDESIELTQAIDPSWADTGLVFSLLKFFVSEEQTAGHRSKDEVELAFSHIPNIYELCRFLQDCHLLSESLDAESDILRLSHDALGPLIASRYNNSQLPGQIANRILTGRFIAADPDSNAAAIAVFDEPDLLLIEAGHGGMRHWTKAEAEVIERSRIAIHKRKRRARLQRIVQGSLVGIVVIFIAIVWQANQRQHLAQSKRSLILLHEAKAQLDPINGNLQKARAHYAEIVDLGYHQDSVFRHLAQFAQNYVFSFYYDTIQSFIPIMERARMDDPHRQSFFGELAFLGILAKDYAFVQHCLALAIPEMKEQTFVRMEKPALRRALIAKVKAHFGQQAWLDWQTKYLPHFVPVPPPLPDKEYPPGIREAICDTFW
ncbi:MAG TPA: hypothetical protein ENJ82_08205, partial [Bacteroidetes bacterium]|nr:hypothetical protein [Bacteroidota bacterium]